MNVTVRCGFGGVALFVLLPPDRDDISGVVSELDAIVVPVHGREIQQCRDDWTVCSARQIRRGITKEK